MTLLHLNEETGELSRFCFFGGGGSSAPPTQTTTSTTTRELSPEQRQLLKLVIPEAEKFVNEPPTLFPDSAIVGLDPLEIQAQQQVLDAIPGQQQFINQTLAAPGVIQGVAADPFSSGAVARTIEGALRPLERTFTTSILPNIRGAATQAGQVGSSRQGIAEGLASQGFLDTAGDVAGGIASQAQTQALDALSRSLFALPEFANLPFAPATAQATIGAQRRGEEQAFLTEEASRFATEQVLPFLAAQEVAALAFGIPAGGTSTQGTTVGAVQQTPGLSFGQAASGVAGILGAILPFFAL